MGSFPETYNDPKSLGESFDATVQKKKFQNLSTRHDWPVTFSTPVLTGLGMRA